MHFPALGERQLLFLLMIYVHRREATVYFRQFYTCQGRYFFSTEPWQVRIREICCSGWNLCIRAYINLGL